MYPKAYIEYLVLFQGYRDYFECHEVLEDHWKKDPVGERKQHWVGLIQIAVTMYHYRRENLIGALKMVKKAQRHLHPFRHNLQGLGLNDEELFKMLRSVEQAIQDDLPYRSVNLPVIDQVLQKQCKAICHDKNVIWGSPSDMTDIRLINKHKLRKRNHQDDK